MRSGKFIVLILLFISAFAKADQLTATFDSANAAYAKGRYEDAIKLYNSIREAGQESATLYFNLGNAYYKTNSIGLAILNYERAKKLSPDDEDLNANLKMAYQKTEDRIEAAPQLFLAEWKNGIAGIMTEKEWSVCVILLICIGLALIAVYITSGNKVLKQVGFYTGSIVLIISIFAFFIAKSAYTSAVSSSSAIITSGSVTVTGSPSEKGTKLFILHEGVKVDITNEQDDWVEVKIANGNVGWIKSANLQKI